MYIWFRVGVRTRVQVSIATFSDWIFIIGPPFVVNHMCSALARVFQSQYSFRVVLMGPSHECLSMNYCLGDGIWLKIREGDLFCFTLLNIYITTGFLGVDHLVHGWEYRHSN